MDVLPDTALILDLKGGTEEEVLSSLIGSLSSNPSVLDAAQFSQAVFDRQRVQPPLLGQGIALPHARTAAVREMVFAIGRCAQPIAFGPDREPVRLIFLYGVPPDQIAKSLAVIAGLVRRLSQKGVVENLLAASTAADFRACLA